MVFGVFVLLAAAASSPCTYDAWPAVRGAEWLRVTRTVTDTFDRQHVEYTVEQDERIIDADAGGFVQELNTRTKGEQPTPPIHVRYRCTDNGPLPIVQEGMTWTGAEIPLRLEPGFAFEYSAASAGGGWTYRNRVTGKEKVTVPAGTFDAWRVDFDRVDTPERKEYSQTTSGSSWWVPGIGMVRKVEHNVMTMHVGRKGQTVIDTTTELQSYHVPTPQEAEKLRNQPTTTLDPDVLKESCGRGKAADCYALGDLYREGIGVQTDHARALALMQKSCDDNYAPACNEAGVYYLWGSVVPKDPKRAAELFKRACDASIAQGCANLGQRYFEGEGVAQDKSRAVALFTSSCKDNSPAGCLYLGRAYADGDGVGKDPAKAAQYFEQACKGKQGEACFRLSEIVGQTDPSRAKQLANDACDNRWAPACHKLAKAIEPADRGVTDPGMHAASYYLVGCKYGYAPSCTSLGSMLEEGRGVQADLGIARELYEKSCGWHDAEGCFHLASLYERGKGVRRDRDHALALYKQACEAKSEQACAAAQRLNR